MSLTQNDPDAAIRMALDEAKYMQHNSNPYGYVPPSRLAETIPERARPMHTRQETQHDDQPILDSDTLKPTTTPQDEESRQLAEGLIEYYRTQVAEETDETSNINSVCNENLQEWAPQLMDRKVYSDALLQTSQHPHIPFYCTTLARGGFWGEVTSKDLSNSKPIYYKPDPYGFLSRTAYAQGKNIPLNQIRLGDLKNVFVSFMSITVYSDFPCAVAIRIGGRPRSDMFKPYNRTEVVVPDSFFSVGSKVSNEQTEFHGVVPPNAKGVVITLYRSGAEVNDPFGAKYPMLTDSIEKITHGCATKGKTEMVVPRRSPILEWVYQNAAYYGWTEENGYLPKVLSEPIDECHHSIRNDVYKTAIARIREKINHCIPVRNLEEFAIEFTPLVYSKQGKVAIETEKLKRKELFHSHLVSKPNSYATRGDDVDFKELMDTYSMTFQLESSHIFRSAEV